MELNLSSFLSQRLEVLHECMLNISDYPLDESGDICSDWNFFTWVPTISIVSDHTISLLSWGRYITALCKHPFHLHL